MADDIERERVVMRLNGLCLLRWIAAGEDRVRM